MIMITDNTVHDEYSFQELKLSFSGFCIAVSCSPPFLFLSHAVEKTMAERTANSPDRTMMRRIGSMLLPMENKASSHTPAALTLEQHLSYQFQYFKEQFLQAASSLGIAVPLDMMEDKSGHIFPFLQASGPKYIFQIMQSHIQNVHLMRCALSLLLITTSLLRKRIIQVDMDDGRLHRVHSTEKEWARQALQKFSDSVTMGSCVNILISTYNPVVQELVLNLMAALISSSNDTVRQMLSAPNSRFSSIAEVNHQKVLSLHLKKLNR